MREIGKEGKNLENLEKGENPKKKRKKKKNTFGHHFLCFIFFVKISHKDITTPPGNFSNIRTETSFQHWSLGNFIIFAAQNFSFDTRNRFASRFQLNVPKRNKNRTKIKNNQGIYGKNHKNQGKKLEFR